MVQIHRIRFVIETDDAVSIHAHPAGVLYALIGEANGVAHGEKAFFPEGAMVLAPEQCRIRIAPGEPYAFGLTLLGDGDSVRHTADAVQRGLVRIGAMPRQNGMPLRGNFMLVRCEDLVTGAVRAEGTPLSALPSEQIDRQVARAGGHKRLTLRFTSPMRIVRPKDHRMPGHGHVDQGFLDGFQLRRRLLERLESLHLVPAGAQERMGEIRIVENGLIWIDFSYGGTGSGKGAGGGSGGGRTDGRTALGGSAGRAVVTVRDLSLIRALVLGQYVHIGQNTRFGFGGYRIEEVGPDPAACGRALGLLDLALMSSEVERAADLHDLPSGSLAALVTSVRKGHDRPSGCIRVGIPKCEGIDAPVRMLAIPPTPDRVVQRALHTQLAPALDRFFEESSMAYRRGLGRDRAARRLRDGFDRGYRWALRTDFASFFDTIDHRLLEHRLLAYLQDERCVGYIMEAVRAGSPHAERGIPTGSPLSPLLANLFLDQFDERIAEMGAMLVRYADDFVVLYRTEAEAQRAYRAVVEAADALALSLNNSKTYLVDLNRPFEFLGFRFERRDGWRATPVHEPCLVEELGWRQADPRRRPLVDAAPLPGETDQRAPDAQAAVLAGPAVESVDVRDGQVVVRHEGTPTPSRFPIDRIRDLVIVGRATITPRLLDALGGAGASCVVTDPACRHPVELVAGDGFPDATLVAAQVDLSRDERWALGLARRLISVKIANHAVLAETSCAASTLRAGSAPMRAVADDLRRLAASAHRAESIESLLGIEGAAAAAWYRLFGRLLPSWCDFSRRIAPDAEDPGNILLNIGQMFLHRQCAVALRAAGLCVSIGLLHTPRSGFAALASDLQEPFRHLIDRAVLHIAHGLRPADFTRAPDDAEYRTVIQRGALRKVMEAFHEAFLMTAFSSCKSTPMSYAAHIHAAARSLARHLRDRSKPLELLEHPRPGKAMTRVPESAG
ncbi:MAG: CRISPR-associated endonuclease Cas1 [Phycisphaeraceae bacterium]|nr:CRISPR-associated endonuclease Cas1 [Phycisphaeraceae bacterium]